MTCDNYVKQTISTGAGETFHISSVNEATRRLPRVSCLLITPSLMKDENPCTHTVDTSVGAEL